VVELQNSTPSSEQGATYYVQSPGESPMNELDDPIMSDGHDDGNLDQPSVKNCARRFSKSNLGKANEHVLDRAAALSKKRNLQGEYYHWRPF
jgi:hypothetical protein